MAFNTRPLQRALGEPAPQYANEVTGDFDFLRGLSVGIFTVNQPANAFPVTGIGGNATLVVGATATGLTGIPEAATSAVMTVEAAPVRFWINGGTPTGASGHLLEPGAVLSLPNRQQVLGFRAVRSSGTDATLQVSYGQRLA